MNGVHGLLYGQHLLFRCQADQAGFGWQFDIHAEPIGVAAGFGNQQRVGVGNGLEVDVTAKLVLLTQKPGNPHQLFHGVVR